MTSRSSEIYIIIKLLYRIDDHDLSFAFVQISHDSVVRSIILHGKNPQEFYSNERATRVVIHSYLYSGLRPSVRGKLPLTMEIQGTCVILKIFVMSY